MNKENINIEYVNEENSRFLKNILRDDISEDFVDSLDVVLEITNYGIEHNCKGHTYAIKYDEKYIGFILLWEAIEWSTDPEIMKKEPFYRLMAFIIDKRYRGCGIGSYILEKVISQCYEEYGIRPIALGVHKYNYRAEKFYVDRGFIKTEFMEGNDYYYFRFHKIKEKIMKREKLSVLGIGPIYVGIILVITAILIFLQNKGYFKNGEILFLKIPFIIIGILCIVIGIGLWISAVVNSRISKNIKELKLVTTGIFSVVRNPIYSAFMFLCWGICFLFNNLYFLVTIPIYWILLTILVKRTEEIWLKDIFGDEYLEYCKRTNRCIPWFSRKS